MHEHDIGAGKRDVGARTDGDAHIRTRQRRRIVDAVTHHGNRGLRGKLAHDALLFGWQHTGNHLVGTHLRLDGLRRAFGIAGEHHRANAHSAQLRDGGGARGLGHIGQGNHPYQLALCGEVDNRLALASQLLSLSFVYSYAVGLHHARIARHAGTAVDGAENALAGNLGEIGGDGKVAGAIAAAFATHELGLCIGHHGARKRMLARLFQRIDQLQQVRLLHAGFRQHIGNLRGALGDGARLVQNHRAHRLRGFQRLSRFHQDAAGGTAPCAHHDGRGSGQAQRARARDNQNRNGIRKRRGEFRAHQHPHHKGNERDSHHHRHEHATDLVGHFLDRGLRAGSLIHQPHNARKHCVGAHALGPHGEPTGRVHRSARNRSTFALGNGKRLAGDNRFVHRAFAFQHHAIYRHRFARAHHQYIAHTHILRRHLPLHAVFKAHCHLGGQVHQLREGVGGLALRARFQELPQRDERQDHARALEVQVHGVMVGGFQVAVANVERHAQQRVHAVQRGRTRTQRNKRIHVGRAVQQRLGAHAEELEVHEYHGHQQHEQHQAVHHHVLHARKHAGQGPAEHVAHGYVEQRHGEHE